MTHKIAVIHYVDGVGKTTTALNLGANLAAGGCRVLLVDLDPQADLSSRLGIEEGCSNLANVLACGGTLQHLVCGWSDPSAASETIEMAIVPSDLQTMAGIDLQLRVVDQPEQRLRQGLADADPALDFILLDCPPVLSLLTINALHAADYVLIPVRAQGKAVAQLAPLVQAVEDVQRTRGGLPRLLGLLLTMFEATPEARDATIDLHATYPELALATIIPWHPLVASDGHYHAPLVAHAPDSPGALAYAQLAEEVLARVQQPA